MSQANHPSQALTLEVDSDSGELRASFDPDSGEQPPNQASLHEALKLSGYAEYFLDDDSIIQFIQQCALATDIVSAGIGERRNAKFELEISDDLMSAWLSLSPAQGGFAIGVQVHDALREQNITFGIIQNELNAALAQGWCDRLLIARGDPIEDGTPGRFDVLFRAPDKSMQGLDEKARVKFRDLSHLLLVRSNDPLMRIVAPKQGKNGKNIMGQVVMAEPLAELHFDTNLQGSKLDSQDPHLLVAAQAGQPVEVRDGVIVNPVITVPNVDLTTGKIHFEGTVHVEGDVKAGMSVRVTGDVIVNGMVEAAQIVAGGNVAIKGGVIGRAEKKVGTQQLADTAARINCFGSVQALFMENAHVEAGNLIKVEQNVRHCELIARNEVIVGKPGSKAGQIIGGLTQASMLVQADVLGTNVATKTRIQVGIDPYLEEQITKTQEVIKRKVADLDQVLKLIVYFERNPQKNIDGVANKVEAKRVQQLAEIDHLSAELAELEAQIELIEKACVKVNKTIYDGVEILIGKQTWQVRQDSGPGTYKLLDNYIVQV